MEWKEGGWVVVCGCARIAMQRYGAAQRRRRDGWRRRNGVQQTLRKEKEIEKKLGLTPKNKNHAQQNKTAAIPMQNYHAKHTESRLGEVKVKTTASAH